MPGGTEWDPSVTAMWGFRVFRIWVGFPTDAPNLGRHPRFKTSCAHTQGKAGQRHHQCKGANEGGGVQCVFHSISSVHKLRYKSRIISRLSHVCTPHRVRYKQYPCALTRTLSFPPHPPAAAAAS